MSQRRVDWADREAERLFDLVRDGVERDDRKIVDAIADSLRHAARNRSTLTGDAR